MSVSTRQAFSANAVAFQQVHHPLVAHLKISKQAQAIECTEWPACPTMNVVTENLAMATPYQTVIC